MSSCPKCRKVSLEQALDGATGLGLPKQPLRCKVCKGTWLDAALLASHEFKEMFAESTLPPEPPELDSKAGLCPAGHGILTRARVELGEPFYLDRCHRCGGVWFDRGEWSRLAEVHLLDSIPQLFSRELQRRQRLGVSRKRELEFLETRLGPELVSDLLGLARKLSGHRYREQALAALREESSNSSGDT